MNHLFNIKRIIAVSISFLFFLVACKKEPTAPSVTTVIVSDITQTTASSGGNVTGDGGAEVSVRGVCWSTTENPTTAQSKTSDGKGDGAFSSSLTQLMPGTKYYVRAYAINDVGTAYGKQQSFNTGEILVATLTTSDVTSISSSTAESGGNISDDGGGAVSARGICWSTSENPTTADNKTTDGSGTGIFTSSISGLSPLTTYYVRAYATNSAGTNYGNQVSFTSLENSNEIIFNPDLTYGSVSDYDGNTYKTIEVVVAKGVQVWMAENLKTTKFNDGTDIPLVEDFASWSILDTPGYCWYNNDEVTYKDTYGALYNWYTVNSGKLCPAGWHVATDYEWAVLAGPTGRETTMSGKFRETGTTHWSPTNTGATNETGFTALPGGYRHHLLDAYGSINARGFFWTSTEVEGGAGGNITAWNREFIGGAIYILKYNYNKKSGHAVRCMKEL